MFGKRPNWPSCRFCGRQYGKSSIGIHESRCSSLFEKQSANLPREYQIRHKKYMDKLNKTSNFSVSNKFSKKAKSKFGKRKYHTMKIRNKGSKKPSSKSIQREEEPKGFLNLIPCQYCSRTFRFDRIQKHEKVCVERKSKRSRKRGIFKSYKQRKVDGVRSISYSGKRKKKSRKNKKKTKMMETFSRRKTNWREKRKAFIDALRSAKKYEQSKKGFSSKKRSTVSYKPQKMKSRSNPSGNKGKGEYWIRKKPMGHSRNSKRKIPKKSSFTKKNCKGYFGSPKMGTSGIRPMAKGFGGGSGIPNDNTTQYYVCGSKSLGYKSQFYAKLNKSRLQMEKSGYGTDHYNPRKNYLRRTNQRGDELVFDVNNRDLKKVIEKPRLSNHDYEMGRNRKKYRIEGRKYKKKKKMEVIKTGRRIYRNKNQSQINL